MKQASIEVYFKLIKTLFKWLIEIDFYSQMVQNELIHSMGIRTWTTKFEVH